MKCIKCGTEFNANIISPKVFCPLCNQELTENIPYIQLIDIFRIIINKFGVEIYSEKARLLGLMNDLIPNTSKEKTILKTVISQGVTQLLMPTNANENNVSSVLTNAYESIENIGLDSSWCAISLYILASALGIDSTKLYPIVNCENKSEVKSLVFDYNEDYTCKSLEELFSLISFDDVIALTELGERYFIGNELEKDVELAISYLQKAADLNYPVAEYILGKIYSEGKDVIKNLELSFEYYKKSAQKNYAEAQYSLGSMYYFGEGCIKNDYEAIYWLSKSSEKLNDSDVFIALGIIYKESTCDKIKNEKKAFEFIEKAAELKNENAYNILGNFYEIGFGVEKNFEKAFSWYKLAADNGVEMAYLNVGAYYQNGVGVTFNELKATEYYKYGANAKNMYCLNALGMCYKNGFGVEKNYKKAFDLFIEAALAGNFAGELNAALAYDKGEGILEDKFEAKKWFTLAAEHGSGKAMFALGVYFENGFGSSKKDLDRAFYWYKKSAEVGDYPDAGLIVGNCYAQGLLNVKIDKCEAFIWFLKSAELGQPTAQNNVAVEYIKGEIIDIDYKIAIEWFEKAVKQDDVYALCNYGTLLLNGEGVTRDVQRALTMLNKSAELGYPESQYKLGVCYFEGWGIERDLDLALKWLVSSKNAGIEEAIIYLKKGYKEKNGEWVKRGFFNHVPAPNKLPISTKSTEFEKGCKDLCEYANLSKSQKLYSSDDFCYCELLKNKVFVKRKCPFFEDFICDLLS